MIDVLVTGAAGRMGGLSARTIAAQGDLLFLLHVFSFSIFPLFYSH